MRKSKTVFIGAKLGKLTVIKRLPNKGRHAAWECLCSCGNKTIGTTPNLQSKQKQSCGCILKEIVLKRNKNRTKPLNEVPINNVFLNYKRKLKYSFNLSKEQFKELINKNCYYCNSPPSNKSQNQNNPLDFILYNGIDRVDNNLGYEIHNVVTCCVKCNSGKMDSSQEDFFIWIENVYNHRIKKNKKLLEEILK